MGEMVEDFNEACALWDAETQQLQQMTLLSRMLPPEALAHIQAQGGP